MGKRAGVRANGFSLAASFGLGMKASSTQSLRFTLGSLLVPGLFLCLQVGCTKHKPTAAELEALQGTWQGVMLGQETNNKITVSFAGNSLHFQWLEGSMRSNWYEANFALPPGTNPQQLRATITGYYPTNDVGSRDIGAVVTAIFKIQDGTLTMAGIQGVDQGPPKGVDAFEDNALFRYSLRKFRPQN